MVLQIFISRDGGHKRYASVLAPGQHEGLGYVETFIELGVSLYEQIYILPTL